MNTFVSPRTRVEVVKVTVNLPVDAVEALKEMAARAGTTVTQALKDCISLKYYLDTEAERDGKILVEAKDGTVREVVVLQDSTRQRRAASYSAQKEKSSAKT